MPSLSNDTVTSDLARLRKASSGSSFWRVDLHTHSPASEDSRWPAATTPDDFVAAYAACGISLVAITDHSTGAWVDQLKVAAKRHTNKSHTPFAILPGVELNANGIHVAAILPEASTSASIALLLGRLDLKEGDFGKEATCVLKSISDIAKEVDKDGGFLVGVHCNSGNGVVDGHEGIPRQRALDSITLLEIRAGQSSGKASKTIAYVRNDLGYAGLPFVYSSDSHGPTDIIADVSLVKMHTPSFPGLRQLQYEPQLRTAGTTPPGRPRVTMRGVVIDGTLYEDVAIPLNCDLNVVIGGRGAGKSALIDLISFCLGHSAIAASYQQTVERRLAGFLSEGDEVRVYVSIEGDDFCVMRAMSSSRLRDTIHLTSEPEVFRLRATGPMRENVSVHDLLPFAIYGQGEVMEISKKGDDQLTLIDSFTDLSGVDSQLQAHNERLATVNGERAEQSQKRAGLLEQVAGKPALEKRIEEIDAHLGDPVFSEHQTWEDQRLYLEEAERFLAEVADAMPEDPYSDIELPELPEKTPKESPLKDAHSAIKGLLRQLNASLDRDATSVKDASDALAKARARWQVGYSAAKATLLATLKKLKLTDIEHVHEERQQLLGELNRIQRQLEPAIARTDARLARLISDRIAALDRIAKVLEQRTLARQATAERLNSGLPPNVRVRILPLGDRSLFFALLNQQILDGLGIRNREKHVDAIVSAFTPRELGAIIRNQNRPALAGIGLSDDASTKILALEESQVERIEESLLQDQPVVELKREGHAEFTSLDKLSIGEKCSAILSLLLASDDRPLMIDEPEAELDHEFICNTVVESIRSAKGTRQILVCTHNPNIPVLGDAELVIKVSKVPGEPHCRVDHAAGFEDPTSIHYLKQLEGGEAALQMRSSKYSIVSG